MGWRVVIVCAVGSLGPAAPGVSQEMDSEQKIQAVLAEYVEAWREADGDRLSRVLDPAGSVVWTTTGPDGTEVVSSMSFADVLRRESRPRPEYGLEWAVESLDVVDDVLAVVRLAISRSGGSYVDVLALYNVAGEWRIVSKTFVSRTH